MVSRSGPSFGPRRNSFSGDEALDLAFTDYRRTKSRIRITQALANGLVVGASLVPDCNISLVNDAGGTIDGIYAAYCSRNVPDISFAVIGRITPTFW